MLKVLAPLILAAAVTLGGGWLWHERVVTHLEAQLDARERERDQARQDRDLYRRRVEQLDAELLAREAATRALQDTLAKREQAYAAIRRRIETTPAEDDGPVAPVLRRTLEDLRELRP